MPDALSPQSYIDRVNNVSSSRVIVSGRSNSSFELKLAGLYGHCWDVVRDIIEQKGDFAKYNSFMTAQVVTTSPDDIERFNTTRINMVKAILDSCMEDLNLDDYIMLIIDKHIMDIELSQTDPDLRSQLYGNLASILISEAQSDFIGEGFPSPEQIENLIKERKSQIIH